MEIDVVSKDGDRVSVVLSNNNWLKICISQHLLFLNFPLVSVPQHNANFIAIFRHII